MRVVRPWPRFPREVVNAPSLGTSQSRLDGALSNLIPLKITESQNGLGWKGLYRPSLSNYPALGRDPFHHPRLLKASSSLTMSTARGRTATASLGSLGQGLTAPTVKDFFLNLT